MGRDHPTRPFLVSRGEMMGNLINNLIDIWIARFKMLLIQSFPLSTAIQKYNISGDWCINSHLGETYRVICQRIWASRHGPVFQSARCYIVWFYKVVLLTQGSGKYLAAKLPNFGHLSWSVILPSGTQILSILWFSALRLYPWLRLPNS